MLLFSVILVLLYSLISLSRSIRPRLSLTLRFQMEKEFLEWLEGNGITSTTSAILVKEDIVTKDIFYSLGHDHFNVLSKRLKIGQHAVLVKMWENVSGNFFSRPHPLLLYQPKR